MAANHPVLGAEIFQIQPQRLPCGGAHRRHLSLRQRATEGLDHHVGQRLGLPVRRPMTDLHPRHLLPLQTSICLGAECDKGRRLVDPQTHVMTMLGGQLAGQPPGHPDVAVVVHHTAENVPARHAFLLCSFGAQSSRPAVASRKADLP
ncbi:hypothetical protein D3C85_1138310 [compost metagenome]